MESFGQLLRAFRSQRGRTQQQLAEEANISTRHLSFIETGRAQPSRDMVAVLLETLDVPARDRNAWYVAAGFAPVYSETALDAETLAEARAALSLILRAHEPFAAVCLDRRGDVRMVNRACLELARALGVRSEHIAAYELIAIPRPNLVSLLFTHPGLRTSIVNWNEVANVVVDRGRRELIRARDKPMRALFEALVAASGLEREAQATPRLIVPLELQLGECLLRFFSTITTFGTAFDITLEELRIEALHPADRETEQRIRSGWGG